MKKHVQHSLLFILLGTFCSALNAAEPPAQNSTSYNTNDPISALQTLSTSKSLNLGPVELGGSYDTLLGTIFNAHYSQKISDDWAFGLLGEYGANQTRFNGTLGYQLWQNSQIKFTGEYLTQNLPFDFASGTINQNVSQTAYGLQLQQNLHNPVFQDVNVGGYYSKAPNVGLDNVTFLDNNGLSYTNERNIAGATTQGFNVGTDLILTPTTGLNTTVFYDNVNYNTEFTEDSSENTFGAGGSLALTQIITDRLKVSATSEFRAIYNTYGGALSWAPEAVRPLGLHFSLFGQRLISHNQTPDSNTFGLAIGFLSDDGTKNPGYSLAQNAGVDDIEHWVSTPAVYMQRVMAIAEERTTLNAPTASNILPNTGVPTGGTTVTITGSNFDPSSTPNVQFGGVAATNVIVVNTTTITALTPAHNAGAVPVTVTTQGGTATLNSTYTYTIPPQIIFVSNSTYQGNLGGLAGANAKCNADSAKPTSGFAAGYTYKALLNFNNATTSGVSYYRPDGTTLIAVANGGNLRGSNSLQQAISTITSQQAWTGSGGTPASTCNTWSASAAANSGSVGVTSSASSTYWSVAGASGSSSCTNLKRLYCVSQ